MSKRKANIDLLRLIAIFGIVMFHHFGTKVPNNFVQLPEGFKTDTYFYDLVNNFQGGVSKTSLLMDFCYGHFGIGGNLIFMLITGYFLFGCKVSFSKRVKTVGKVLYAILFYGIILTVIHFAVLKLFYPFACYKGYRPLFTLPNWFSGENLWYLQAYGIFILIILPILKLFEEKLTQKSHLCLALSLTFIHFLAYSNYLPNLWLSTSILQFIMCYYIGGYISKYPLKISFKTLITAACSYVLIYFLYEYYWRYANAMMYKPSQYSYIKVMAPFICCLIYAVLFFLIAVKLELPARFSSKILENISSSSIGIFIFHFNFMSIAYVLAETFWWKNWSVKGFFLFSIIDSFLLVIIGFLLDRVRQWTYKHFELCVKSFILTSEK